MMSSEDMECSDTKSAIALYLDPYLDLPQLEFSCHIVDAARRNRSLSSSVSERISRFTYLQGGNINLNVTEIAFLHRNFRARYYLILCIQMGGLVWMLGTHFEISRVEYENASVRDELERKYAPMLMV